MGAFLIDNLDDSIRQKFKSVCALRGQSMRDAIIEFMILRGDEAPGSETDRALDLLSAAMLALEGTEHKLEQEKVFGLWQELCESFKHKKGGE
jgi:hypothetical protein